MTSRVLPFLGFTDLALSAIFWRSDALAQDVTINNADQLAAVVDESGLWYPLASVVEPSPADQALGVFWADFSRLTNAIGDVRNFDGETQYGITVWRLRLTRTSNEVTLSYPAADTNLWQAPATDSDDFSNHYENVLRGWCILQAAMNYESYDDLIADGYTNLAPKRIVVDIWLADANDCPTYDDNVATANSEALGISTGGFMTMDEDPDGLGSDPCSITNLLQPFSVTSILRTNVAIEISWQSCPMFRYDVFSADALSSDTVWQSQSSASYVWGQPGASASSYTDLSTTNANTVMQRFYRVQRILSNLIAAGGSHSLAVSTNGTLWAWGGNGNGQLGDGTMTNQWSPEEVSSNGCIDGANNVQAVAGGFDYSVVVDGNGTVWSWGDNGAGQLGNGGGGGNFITPFPISGISNVVSVAAGTDHTLALRADGTVWAWGNNINGGDSDGNGQLGAGGLGGASSTNLPVQSLIPTGAVVVAIAAGNGFSLALDSTGILWGWGSNESSQLGTNVVSGRDASTNLPTVVAGISNVIAIATGYDHSVALTTNKSVWTWGGNDSGQLGRTGTMTTPGQVAGLSNVIAIAAGNEYTLAATANGSVYAWGDNFWGELGTNSAVVPLTNFPMLVPAISNAVLVAAPPSGNNSMAVTVMQGTNQYWAWGEDDSGQVGNGTNVDNVETPAGPLPFVHFNTCGPCIQMGTNGTFTAVTTGTLFLYFNDDNFGDNSGSFNATITNVTTATLLGTVTVAAGNKLGVAIGTVTEGDVYSYSASGTSFHCVDGGNPSCPSNPSGVDPDTGVLWTCINNSNFICPDNQCWSLVGKIE